MKAANGKRSNFRVPYGYKRDELDKEKWLVDEAAAEVVQRIYHLCLEGKGPEQIARLLQKEKVLTPTAYYYSVGSSSANRPMPSDPYLWKDSTIDAILSNRKYTGCMVNLKTTTVSYKVHMLIRKPEEECRAGTNRLSGGQRSCRFRHLSRIILSANDWKATIRGKRSEYPIC